MATDLSIDELITLSEKIIYDIHSEDGGTSWDSAIILEGTVPSTDIVLRVATYHRYHRFVQTADRRYKFTDNGSKSLRDDAYQIHARSGNVYLGGYWLTELIARKGPDEEIVEKEGDDRLKTEYKRAWSQYLQRKEEAAATRRDADPDRNNALMQARAQL
jgi:hypothetical protein